MNDRSLRVAAALVAVAGIGVAGYLTWAHYADVQIACLRGGGCETVQDSSYSEIAGVPVALIGLLGYSAILALIAWDAPTARLAVAALAVTGLLFSVYLLILQAFVIDAFCVWCLANDIVAAPALAGITALRLRPAAPTS